MPSFLDLQNSITNINTNQNNNSNNNSEEKEKVAHPLVPISMTDNRLDEMRKASDKGYSVLIDKELQDYNEAGFNYNPAVDIHKTLVDKQSTGEQFANSMLRLLWSEGLIATVQTIPEIFDICNYYATGSKNFEQNDASLYLQQVRDDFNAEHEIYMKEGTNMLNGGFADGSWWFNNLPNIISSLTLLLPSKAVSFLGSKVLSPIIKGTARALQVGKLEKGVQAAKAFNNVSRKAVSHSTRAKAFADGVKSANYFTPLSKGMQNFIEVGTEIGLAGYTSRMLENYQEATQVYRDMYDISKEKFIDMQKQDSNGDGISDYDDYINKNRDELIENGVDVTNPKAVAKYIANSSAKVTMDIDMWNLGFDIFQMYALRNVFRTTRKPINTIEGKREVKTILRSLAETNGNAEVVKSAIARNIGNKTLDIGKKVARTLPSAISEGFEEAVNYVAQQEGMTYGKALLDGAAYDTSGNLLEWGKHIGQYTKDGALYDSMFWGFLGGLVFDNIGGVKGFIKDKKLIGKIKHDAEDPRLSEGKYQARVINNTYDQFKKLQDDIAKINSNDEFDEFDKKDAIDALFRDYLTNRVVSHANSGSIDILKEFLSNKEVNEYMSKNFGLTAQETTDLINTWTESIDSVKAKYNMELDRVIKAVNDFKGFDEKRDGIYKVWDWINQGNNMPLEMMQVIASNNVRFREQIDILDKKIEAAKSNILNFNPTNNTLPLTSVFDALEQSDLMHNLKDLYIKIDKLENSDKFENIITRKRYQKLAELLSKQIENQPYHLTLILESLKRSAAELGDVNRAAAEKVSGIFSNLYSKEDVQELLKNTYVKRYVRLLPQQYQDLLQFDELDKIDFTAIGEAHKELNKNINYYLNNLKENKDEIDKLHSRLFELKLQKLTALSEIDSTHEEIWNTAATKYYHLNSAFKTTIDNAVKVIEDLYDKYGLSGIEEIIKNINKDKGFDSKTGNIKSFVFSDFSSEDIAYINDALKVLDLVHSNTYKLFDFIKDIALSHKAVKAINDKLNEETEQGEDTSTQEEKPIKNEDTIQYEKNMELVYNKNATSNEDKFKIQERTNEEKANTFPTVYQTTLGDKVYHEVEIDPEDVNEEFFGNNANRLNANNKAIIKTNPVIIISSTGEVTIDKLGTIAIQDKDGNTIDYKEQPTSEQTNELESELDKGTKIIENEEDTSNDAAMNLGKTDADKLQEFMTSILYKEDKKTLKDEVQKLINEKNTDGLITYISSKIDYTSFKSMSRSIIDANISTYSYGFTADNVTYEDYNEDQEEEIKSDKEASDTISEAIWLHSRISEEFIGDETLDKLQELNDKLKLANYKNDLERYNRIKNNKTKAIIRYIVNLNKDKFKRIEVTEGNKTIYKRLINIDDLLRIINSFEQSDNKTHKASAAYNVILNYLKNNPQDYILTDDITNKDSQLNRALSTNEEVLEKARTSLVNTTVVRINIDSVTHDNPETAKVLDNLQLDKPIAYEIKDGKIIFKSNGIELGSLTIPIITNYKKSEHEFATKMIHAINNIKTDFIITEDGTYYCEFLQNISNIFDGTHDELVNDLFNYIYNKNNQEKYIKRISKNEYIQSLLNKLNNEDRFTIEDYADDNHLTDLCNLLTSLMRYTNFTSLDNKSIQQSIELFFDATFNNCMQTISINDYITKNNIKSGEVNIESANNGEILRTDDGKRDLKDPFKKFKVPSQCIITNGKLQLGDKKQVFCYCKQAGILSNSNDDSQSEVGAFREGSTFIRIQRLDGSPDYVQVTGCKLSEIITNKRNQKINDFFQSVLYDKEYSLLAKYLKHYVKLKNTKDVSNDEFSMAYDNIKNLFDSLFLSSTSNNQNYYRNLLRPKEGYRYNINNYISSYIGFYYKDINNKSVQPLSIYGNFNDNTKPLTIVYYDNSGKKKEIKIKTEKDVAKGMTAILNCLNEIATININFALLHENISKIPQDSYSYCGFEINAEGKTKFILKYTDALDYESEPVIYEFDDYVDFLIQNDLVKLNLDYDPKRMSNYEVKGSRSQMNNAYIKINSTQIVGNSSPVGRNTTKPVSSKSITSKTSYINDFIDSIKDEKSNKEITLDEIFKLIRVINNVDENDENVNKLLNSLQTLGLLKNNIIFAPDNEVLNKPIKKGGAYASYNKKENKIYVGKNWLDLISHKHNSKKVDAIRRIMHENIHQLINGINSESKSEFYNKAKQYRNQFKEYLNKDNEIDESKKKQLMQYLTDTLATDENSMAEEFIVYALTSKTLSDYLNSIQSTETKTESNSLLDKIKEILTKLFKEVKQAFNVNPDSLLNDIIDNTSFIFNEDNQKKTETVDEEQIQNKRIYEQIDENIQDDWNDYSRIEEYEENKSTKNNITDIIIDTNSKSLNDSLSIFPVQQRADLATKINAAELNITCR